MWTIKLLTLGHVELDASRTVQTQTPGTLVRVPVNAFLLSGPGGPILVDTGFRHPDILGRLGMRGFEAPEETLDAQLARHGARVGDIRLVVHTHLHIDHAGQTDRFPMTTTVVVNRRELEYSVSGLSGASYPPEDIKHLIDRLHTRKSLRLLDVEATGGEFLAEGLRCVAAGGHTEGSMVLYVDTAEGVACICGDILYSIRHQLIAGGVLDAEPFVSGNTVMARREERAAIKRVLNSQARFLYPSHDGPCEIAEGRIRLM